MITTSMFGQVPLSVNAGDPAPNLTWTKIVAYSSGSGGPRHLLGQTTVLLFLRPVSHNEQAVSNWNRLVEQFAGKPVNFVWIANEREKSLVPFLKSNPVRGWMVLDPQEESYKAYGVEGADGVLIESKGTIAGFTLMSPNAAQIQAVLDGHAIAVKDKPTESQMDAFFEGRAVRLEAEPFRSLRPPQKPNLPPSDEVHISHSQTDGTVSSTGPDHWMQCGFDLRTILSKVSATSPIRIELPAALDNGTRYDFVLVPPREEDEETINRKVRDAIGRYFHVTITPEIQTVDVYVMTAVKGKTPPKKSEDEAFCGSIGSISRSFRSDEISKLLAGAPRTRRAVEEATRRAMESPQFRQAMAMAQLTALSSSMDDFRRALEDGLHRPVVDETGLTGVYDFKIQEMRKPQKNFSICCATSWA